MDSKLNRCTIRRATHRAALYGRERLITTQETTDKVIEILEDRKAENIRVFDVRGKSSLADTIIVASGTSSPHLKALAGNLQRELKKLGEGATRVSGDSESAWVVLDLYDVIVHMFLPEAREYYNIESLWQN